MSLTPETSALDVEIIIPSTKLGQKIFHATLLPFATTTFKERNEAFCIQQKILELIGAESEIDIFAASTYIRVNAPQINNIFRSSTKAQELITLLET